MKKTLSLIFFLLSFTIYSQYTLIPDINFEKMLISQSIDNGIPDGKVLTSSINNLKTLNISKQNDYNNKIKDLTGIQDFLDLQFLDCGYNELTSIDLSKNLALTTLYCHNNFLLGLDISKNINLGLLNCTNNKLSTLDISNNLNLVHFFCEFNSLKTLDMSNNLKLMIFYAGYNQFTNLDVSKNINLSIFHCDFNKLTNLDLSKNINLVELACIYNSLTNLDVSKNTKLDFLSCTNNLLISLNLKNGNNTNLRYNSISPFSPNSSFKSNPNLFCITVDDITYSNANWSSLKDARASFTTIDNLAPVISSPQFFCIANNQTLTDIDITTGTNLTWYNASTGGNMLLNTTPLIDGMTYYASQNSGGCESTRTQIKVFVGDSQPPIPILSNLPDITGDCHTLITTIPTAIDACAGTITATTVSSLSYNLPGTYTIIWNYNDGNGNSISQDQKVIISAQPLPLITSPQSFCKGQNKTLNDIITSTGIAIKWYDSTTNGNLLQNNSLLTNGSTYYASQTINGCESTRIGVKAIVEDNQKPQPNLINLPEINGDCHTTITAIPIATDACAGTITATTVNPLSYSFPGTYTIVWDYNDGNGNITHQNQTVTISSQPLPTATTSQTFCIQQNPTLNSISITSQNIKWYDSLTAENLLSNTTILQDSKIYYASQTINGCESERVPVTITIQNTLAPTGNTNQTFCTGQNPTIANILVTGNSIKWYDDANNGSLLAETTDLQNGKTYYASQTVNNCEGSRLGVTVSIVNTPPAPTGNTSQAFCKNQNASLNTIQISGQNIKWYDSRTSTTVLPNTTLLENNTTYYASQTVGCESARTAVLIQINDTALPTGSNSQQFCIDENATIANLNITGTNLKWYNSAVNGNISQDSALHNGVYYATQTLNNCESERYAVTVKVQDTQIPIADSPQVFCIQKNALIRDIDITGQNIEWYESASSNITLPKETQLKNGIAYYTTQTTNNCTSKRIPIVINILKANARDCINLSDDLPFPKFFTPNNDGYNDHWTIDFAYLAQNTKIRIFDRYGKIIKELNHSDSWDGTYNGYGLPATDYWFVVTGVNGKEYRGHFSLKR